MFSTAKIPFDTLTKARKARPEADFNCNNKELLEEEHFPTILDLETLSTGGEDKD